jgi:hypothetical protein
MPSSIFLWNICSAEKWKLLWIMFPWDEDQEKREFKSVRLLKIQNPSSEVPVFGCFSLQVLVFQRLE